MKNILFSILRKTIFLFSISIPQISYCQVTSTSCNLANTLFVVSQNESCNNGDWVLVFEDDFDYTSIDQLLQNWDVPYQGVWRDLDHEAEKQWYANTGLSPNDGLELDHNIEISNSSIKLIAKHEVPSIIGTYVSDFSTQPWTFSTESFEYSSAEIDTKRTFQYGKFEILARFPTSIGFFPAFWLFDVGSTGDYNEIDVFEYSFASPYEITTNLHYPLYNTGCVATYGGIDFLNWHKYTLVWDIDKIEFYVDDVLIRKVPKYWNTSFQPVYCNDMGSINELMVEPTFPKDPMKLILNLAISNHEYSPSNTTPFPSSFEIGYVKVWKRHSECCIQNKLFESTANLPAITQVDDYIIAGNDAGISGVSGNVTVKNGQSVTFVAGNNIALKPGFSIQPGGNFTAKIQECTPLTMPEGDEISTNSIPDEFSPDGDGIDDELCVSVNGATSYSILVTDKDPPYNSFYLAENVPINSDPFCVWDGECNYTGNCWLYHKCNRQREIHLDFYNCDKSLYQTKIIDVNCSSQNLKMTDSINTLNILNTNLNGKSTFEFKITLIPNPNSGNMQVNYEIPDTETGTFIVYDILGKTISSSELMGGKNSLSISLDKQRAGIYFYKAFANNKQIAADKIVVIK